MDITMTEQTTTSYQTFLGFDVGKETIAVHDSTSGEGHVVANRAADLRRFLRAYGGESYAVCEATGGYERVLLDCLEAAKITAHRGLRSANCLCSSRTVSSRRLASGTSAISSTPFRRLPARSTRPPRKPWRCHPAPAP